MGQGKSGKLVARGPVQDFYMAVSMSKERVLLYSTIPRGVLRAVSLSIGRQVNRKN